MLGQLARQSPNAVLTHLEALLPPLQKTLEIRVKTDAVKQEVRGKMTLAEHLRI